MWVKVYLSTILLTERSKRVTATLENVTSEELQSKELTNGFLYHTAVPIYIYQHINTHTIVYVRICWLTVVEISKAKCSKAEPMTVKCTTNENTKYSMCIVKLFSTKESSSVSPNIFWFSYLNWTNWHKAEVRNKHTLKMFKTYIVISPHPLITTGSGSLSSWPRGRKATRSISPASAMETSSRRWRSIHNARQTFSSVQFHSAFTEPIRVSRILLMLRILLGHLPFQV